MKQLFDKFPTPICWYINSFEAPRNMVRTHVVIAGNNDYTLMITFDETSGKLSQECQRVVILLP